ncbi:iron-sulfur cluster repair di-iron protein [Clostridium thermarum]|uniref:iron-sulfur cluster repair di-iron protein n=1 Tax=Clostridium thermarum TaxID=1716543 RepID=UPI0013D44807|nr:iron-sulfur cluster repair di-iron protein [Clostridium thermarum]
MNSMFSLNSKIGEVVVKFPRAIETFKKNKIDFCCGGDRPLEQAVKEQGLDGAEIVAEINEAYNTYVVEAVKDREWAVEPYTSLIDYVVNTHHAYLNENLPKLSELTTKILRVHGEHHPELKKVHKIFHSLKMELEQHLIKEEEAVFPLVIQYDKSGSLEVLERAVKQIEELEDEHESAGTTLKELREITNGYTMPEDGCASYGLTYRIFEELEDDLFRHIHLENNIMFPRLEEELKKIG